MFFILISIFIVDLSHAAPGDGEPLRMRYVCDEQRVNQCLAQNQAAHQGCYARAREYDENEALVNKELAPVIEQRAVFEAARKTTDQKLEIIRAEAQFIDDLGKNFPSAPKIFSGAPALEQIFFFDQSASVWDERYPLERGEKLRAQLTALTISSQKNASAHDENESKIALLTRARDELTRQKNHWIHNGNVHANMLAGGCRNQVCNGR